MHFLKQLTSSAFLLVIFGISACFGQSHRLDSLKEALQQTDAVEDRTELLLQLARLSGLSERESSIAYYTEALEYTQDPFLSGTILDTIGLKYWQNGNYHEAIQAFKNSLLFFEEIQDSLWLAKVNNNLGVVNWGMGNGNEAMKYYQESLKIRRAINDKRGISTVLNNIGIIYLDWGLAEETFTRFKEAMDIAVEINDGYAIAYCYTNLGAYYKFLKQYDEAIKNYKLGFETEFKRSLDQASYAYLLANIGGGFREMGSLDSALNYYHRSLNRALLHNNTFRIATAEYNLGKTHLMLNDLDSAQLYIELSLNRSLEKSYTSLIEENLYALAEIEEHLGDFQNAHKHFKRASVLKDSLFNQNKLLKFNELQIQYSLEQEEIENTLLRKNLEINKLTIRKQNILRAILIAGILLVLVMLFLILKSRNTYRELTKELKTKERELKNSNTSKDRFISIISHDLRNPVTTLVGISDLLDSKYDTLSPEEVKKLIGAQLETSENANKLLDDLLEWAKAHTGKVALRAETLDLCEQIKGVSQLLSQRAQDKKISIENRVVENTLVQADKKATDTVIRNIVSNAIKFTEPGGRITLKAEKDGKEMKVSISDTGVGMSDEVRENLFRIDIHHNSLGTNKETGTGLGLILCKELLEKQGGRIWVESQLGEGSKFIFTLPLPDQDSE